MDIPRKSIVSKGGSKLGNSRTGPDSRQISDKSFQASCKEDLINYFQEKISEAQITAKNLQTPNTKDFVLMFTTLMRRIDPSYELAGKIDEEIPQIFKFFGYPYTISKNSLLAVGAPNSWPSLLASLHWLLDFVKMNEVESVEDRNIYLNEEGSENEVFIEHMLRAYELFLQTKDYSEDIKDLVIYLRKQVTEKVSKMNETKEIVDILRKERDELKFTVMNYNKLDSKIENSISYVNSSKGLMANLHAKMREIEELKANKIRVFTEKEHQFTMLQHKNTELYKIINSQELSIEDVKRMKKEEESLDEAISSLEDQNEKLKEMIHKLQDYLKKLIAEASEIIARFNRFSIENPISKQTLMLSFFPENLKNNNDLYNPADFFEELKSAQQVMLLSINDNIAFAHRDIPESNSLKCQKRIELEEIISVIEEKRRNLSLVQEKLKSDPGSFNAQIEIRMRENRILDDELKELRKVINEHERHIKKLNENLQSRSREREFIEKDFAKSLDDAKKCVYQGYQMIHLMESMVKQCMDETRKFLQDQVIGITEALNSYSCDDSRN